MDPVDRRTTRSVADESAPRSADSFERLLRRLASPTHVPSISAERLAMGRSLAAGRLTVGRCLGEGGMGTVHEAFDAQRGERVALKVLHGFEAADVYQLKSEFRALAGVRHDHVVQLHELFVDDSLWFFTLELIDGQSFDRYVRPDGVLDEARLRATLPQLLEALRAIHGAGKLHRDLKPSNVLVTPEGRLVVLDFGLAADPEPGGVGQTLADAGGISGTPAYMAPEQAAGRCATSASDVYAIGAMLFEALTGRLPFEGTIGRVLAEKQTDEAPAVTAFAPEAPGDLSALCAQMLSREPAARPDVEALAVVLGRASALAARRGPASTTAELLGREAELRVLYEALEATLDGQSVVVFLSGESGIGKSALVGAFIDALRVEGRATVLAGRCLERENVPYKGFDALVDELSRYLRTLPDREAAALLPREVYALVRIFPVLDRVGVVAAAPRKVIPDPQDLKARAFAAFGELIARMRDRGPLVVAIDDLQWLDQDSMRFMRTLLLQPDPPPILFVCVHRSEGAEQNAMLQAVVQGARENAVLAVRTCVLSPLGHEPLVTLARHLLPAGVDASAAETFAREAQGSPFFLAELARAAAFAPAATQPLSLPEALARHVGALPADAQSMLALLALAGQPLSPQLVVEAAGFEQGHVLLDRLRAEQLVRVSFDGDGGRRVECYHDKVREEVGAALDVARTQRLALGLANALSVRTDSDAELLARALDLADRPAEAAQQAARAADRAFAALAFERAASLYTRALRNGRFEPGRSLELYVGRARALAHAGQGVQAAEAFLEASASAPPDVSNELTREAADQFLLCGHLSRGRELYAKALGQLRMAFPRSLGVALARVSWLRLRLRFRGFGFTARTTHDPVSLRELEVLRSLTHSLVRSDMVRAAAFGARWLLRALELGHEVEIGRALAWEVLFASVLGAPEARVEAARVLCTELGDRTQDPTMLWFLDYTVALDRYVRVGDSEATIAHLDRALDRMNAHPTPTTWYDRVWAQYWRASAVATLGRFVECGEVARPLFEQALARGDQTVGMALAQAVVFGDIAADRPEQAARVLQAATTQLHTEQGTVQHFMWVGVAPLVDLYRGEARRAWYDTLSERKRFLGTFMARINAGGLEQIVCGVASAAAAQAETPAERRALSREAVKLARRARRARFGFASGSPEAVIACLRGDRDTAIAALHAALHKARAPFVLHLTRRRLGELLGGSQGAALILEADAAMRATGIVDPARFTAALIPGVELPGPVAGVSP